MALSSGREWQEQGWHPLASDVGSLTEPDGTRLVALGASRRSGMRVFTSQQLVDLPGTALMLRVDGWRGLVSHNWGSQHAERWIWMHCALENGWLELVLGRHRDPLALVPGCAAFD